MPKLWSETVDDHRAAVREATLDVTAALVVERGLASVTMSEVAKRAGVGRATLYKYFPDVGSILTAWHERQVGSHLQRLSEIRDRGTDRPDQLEAVLTAYASMSHGDHADGIAVRLHQGRHVTEAHQQLYELLEGLVVDGVRAGRLRSDVPPGELVTYCLGALASAGSLTSKAAVRRLVTLTIDGMSA